MTLCFVMDTKILFGRITTCVGYLHVFLVPLTLAATVVDIGNGTSGEHLKSVSKNYSSAVKTDSVFEDALIAKRKYQRHNKLPLGINLKGFKGM